MLRRNSLILVAVVAGLGLSTACSDADPLGGGGDSDIAEEMVVLALDADLITEEVVLGELDAMSSLLATTTDDGDDSTPSEVLTEERSFSRTRTCPGGGEMRVEGSLTRVYDPDTGVMEVEASGARNRTGCIFGRGELTVTVDGSSQWEISRRRVDGEPDGPQTSHYSGSWTAVRSDGETRTCEFDYTVVRDPASRSRTVEGTLCGRRHSRGMSWDLRQ